MELAPPLTRLMDALRQLPGIGQKSAQRIAFHLMRVPRDQAEELARATLGVKDELRFCSQCGNITDSDPCRYCSDPGRNPGVICVVEEPHNVLSVEKSRQFQGMYHVLGGALSPLAGVGPDQLNIASLMTRLRSTRADGTPLVREVIVATDPNADGEATALYLARLIKPLGVEVSRIGIGIPVGGEIEYADEVTMTRALEGRRPL
ncbi:MAG: recombination mediator RecR [Terriglobales bacterium]